MITKDDVEIWRDNPVTKAVTARIDTMESEAKAAWMTALRQPLSGVVLEQLRIELASKLQLIDDYRHLSREDIVDDEEDKRSSRS